MGIGVTGDAVVGVMGIGVTGDVVIGGSGGTVTHPRDYAQSAVRVFSVTLLSSRSRARARTMHASTVNPSNNALPNRMPGPSPFPNPPNTRFSNPPNPQSPIPNPRFARRSVSPAELLAIGSLPTSRHAV